MFPSSALVPDVQKIAVLRALALGDFLFALPALQALYQAYPQAEIVYLGRNWHTSYLPGRIPGIRRIISIPPAQGTDIHLGRIIDSHYEEAFLQEMRAEQFDLAFQMQGGGSMSNPFVSAFGARITAGARAANAPPLDRWIPYTYYQSETIRMLEIVALAGAHSSVANLQPTLAVLPTDLAEAAPILQEIRKPFAVLHPGSTDPRRCWAPEQFATVGDFLYQTYGMEIVLTGVSYEETRLAAVQTQMHSPSHNLCGQLSLTALTGLLSQATFLVSNDTGPLHLALALGVRAVGLFWAEYIINSLPLARSNFLPVISWERTCPQCGREIFKNEADHPQDCVHEVSFIDNIAVDQVIRAVEQLLSP